MKGTSNLIAGLALTAVLASTGRAQGPAEINQLVVACQNGNVQACQMLLTVATRACQAGNQPSCQLAAMLSGATGGTTGSGQSASNPAALVGVWGTSSTQMYGGNNYGLSYTFNRDGTYTMQTSMGTSMHGIYAVNGSQIVVTSLEPRRPPKQWTWAIGNNEYGRMILRLNTETGQLDLYRR